MPCIVGLTGGIATGKSSVSQVWRAASIPVIDADEIARDVVRPGRPALLLIRLFFGVSVLQVDGSLDRAALGRVVFNDAAKRRKLNMIMHPFIITRMIRGLLYHTVIRLNPVVILDTPLLFESGTLLPLCSKKVVVSCSPEQQLNRLLERSRNEAAVNGGPILTEDDARSRINSQMPLGDKVARADHVIDNSGTPEDLTNAAKRLLHELQPSPAGEACFRMFVIGIFARVVLQIARRGVRAVS